MEWPPTRDKCASYPSTISKSFSEGFYHSSINKFCLLHCSSTDPYSKYSTKSESDLSLLSVFEELKLLKKENLDLRLKIYFMENERSSVSSLSSSFDENNLYQENVQLKCELEKYKEEIERKNLLIKESLEMLDNYDIKLTEMEKLSLPEKVEREKLDCSHSDNVHGHGEGIQNKGKYSVFKMLSVPILLTIFAVGVSRFLAL